LYREDYFTFKKFILLSKIFFKKFYRIIKNMADNIVLDEFNKIEIIRKFNDNLPKLNDNLSKLNDNLSKLNDNLSKYNENFDNFKKQDLQLNQNLHLNLKDQIVKLQERVQILEVREVKDQIEKIQQKVQNLEQQNKMVQNKENYEDIVNFFDHFENHNFDSPLNNDNFDDIEILPENLLSNEIFEIILFDK
jgi:X-X-X-Leu-X-X-Gly heptad repeat protein